MKPSRRRDRCTCIDRYGDTLKTGIGMHVQGGEDVLAATGMQAFTVTGGRCVARGTPPCVGWLCFVSFEGSRAFC